MSSASSHALMGSDNSQEDINEQGILLPRGMTVEKLAKRMSEVTAHPTAESVRELGTILFESKHYFAAIPFLLNVARHKDDLGVLLSIVDLLMQYTMRNDIVIIVLKRILELAPFLVPCRIYLARAYFMSGDLVKGTQTFNDIIRSFPQQREMACENVGACLLEMGYFNEAYQIFKIWLDLGGGETPTLAGNMACTLARLNKLDEANKWYKKAMKMLPNDESLEVGYGLNLFKQGLFKEGYPYYSRRSPRVLRKEGWFVRLPRLTEKSDVKGRKICLYHEQGLGDTLQFIRFLPILLKKGAKVTLFVPGAMERLFKISFPQVSFGSMAATEKQAGKFDYSLPIADLPFVCGLKRNRDIPDNVPYLHVRHNDVKDFGRLLGKKRPAIGIVWSGQNRFNPAEAMTDKRRSILFKTFIDAITPIDAQLVSLQFGEREGDLKEWTGQKITDPMPKVKDMADTASIIANLDLLISVDTSVVHLAGGLDLCPIWLISRWDACWRWGATGENSPWYPHLRIFRPKEHDFKPILKEIGQELSHWLQRWKKNNPS